MKKFMKMIMIDIIFWFVIWHTVTDSLFQIYAYNALSFFIGFKAFIGFLAIIAFKEIKKRNKKTMPSKNQIRYANITCFLEVMVLATFGFNFLAIGHAFSWFVFMALTSEDENANEKQ